MKNWLFFGFALAVPVLVFGLWAGWIVWQSAQVEPPIPFIKPVTCMSLVDRYGNEVTPCFAGGRADYMAIDAAVGFHIYTIRWDAHP